MTKLLTKPKREQLRQLVLDCTLMRLTTAESLEHIQQKLRVKITDRYFFIIKKTIVDNSSQLLTYLQQNRNAYLANFFERIAKLYKHQRETWEMYYDAKERGDNKFQLECIKHLGDISVSLADLYNMVPNLGEIRFEFDKNEKDYDYSKPQLATEMHPGEYSREAKFRNE